MKSKIANQIVDDSRLRETKRASDTVQVWENFREQALLWRAIALLQIPATFGVLIFAAVIWANRSITLSVPLKPLPGQYLANEITDDEFIGFATDFVNLIATYQPRVARRQFAEATKYLAGPTVASFEEKILGEELSAIERTSRTQLFFVDPLSTQIIRQGNNLVEVRLVGERSKIVGAEELDPVLTRYSIVMSTIPRNTLNPFGIVITRFESINDLKDIRKELREYKRQEKKDAREANEAEANQAKS
jgi:hypothetical protein